MFETLRRRHVPTTDRERRRRSRAAMGATVPTIAAGAAIAGAVALPFNAAAAPLDDDAHQLLADHLPASVVLEPRTSLLDACPIDGDHDWEDSWGWPRSGGRRHQGIDVAADRGTELYAVRDGSVDFKQTNLGGNSVWLVAPNGDRFFYAHLSGFVGDDRDVEAGELIGFVGSTGNAGGPHLHFETHPDGSPENPYPHVVEICERPDPEAEAVAAFLDRVRLTRAADAARIAGASNDASPGPATKSPR